MVVVSTTTADIPSSSTLPRPSILRTKSSSDVSITSNDSKTSNNITFAPLPIVEPRKRRNNRPIGLAGRAEMLRKSRRPFIATDNTYEEEEVYVSQREEDDIPLPDIGKLVKGFWRSISRGTRDKNGGVATDYSSLRSQHNGDTAEEHEKDGEEKGSEGNVWMEEVTWSPTLGFVATSFTLRDQIKNPQGNTSSSGTFLEKLEGMKDGEDGMIRGNDEHDPHVKGDTATVVVE